MAKIDDYGERECPVCGKIFFTWSMDRWGYKLYNRQRDRYRLYCSWTCLREAQKKQKKVKLHRKREKVIDAELTGNHMKIKEAVTRSDSTDAPPDSTGLRPLNDRALRSRMTKREALNCDRHLQEETRR